MPYQIDKAENYFMNFCGPQSFFKLKIFKVAIPISNTICNPSDFLPEFNPSRDVLWDDFDSDYVKNPMSSNFPEYFTAWTMGELWKAANLLGESFRKSGLPVPDLSALLMTYHNVNNHSFTNRPRPGSRAQYYAELVVSSDIRWVD
jgi:hypothetical protein